MMGIKVKAMDAPPHLLVMGHYRMGGVITPQDGVSLLRIFIDYKLPDAAPSRWLGILLGRSYARWCVQQMMNSAVKHFHKKERQ